MREFAYSNVIDNFEAKKIVRKLIYTFFKGNIKRTKVFIDGFLKDKTYFSFKRPFGTGEAIISTPSTLTELFPDEKLFVLRHYKYKNNNLPLFLVRSDVLQKDLEDLNHICNYEYSYIFNKNFSHCFFITGSYNYEEPNYVAILQLYKLL